MSLYLLLAIALGALTGVADAPAPRPAFAGVVALPSEARSKRRQAIGARVPLLGRMRPAQAGRRLYSLLVRRSDAPLTGAASPRGPSHNG
jgi:hypothetical protein